MLEDVIDLVPVYTSADAFQALVHEKAAIDLIIATIAFDDSRMVEFLQAVKRDPTMKHIPFLCSRLLPGVLSDQLVDRMRVVCMQCDAADFVDVARLPPDEAQSVLRAAVIACAEAGKPR
jgi:hypothetical protein